MKKTVCLDLQGFEHSKLSRREFLMYSTMFASLGILSILPVKSFTQIVNAIHTIGIDVSTERLGKWMRNNLTTDKSLQIVTEVERDLKSVTALSKKNIREMISSDYLQGRTVDISNIRFSRVEVALCIASSTYDS